MTDKDFKFTLKLMWKNKLPLAAYVVLEDLVFNETRRRGFNNWVFAYYSMTGDPINRAIAPPSKGNAL